MFRICCKAHLQECSADAEIVHDAADVRTEIARYYRQRRHGEYEQPAHLGHDIENRQETSA
jgi:hypothetical protein